MDLPVEENGDLDEADPSYMFFLDHLRQVDNSLIFEMVETDGSLIEIKYDGENEWDEISNPKTPETLESAGLAESSEQTDRSSPDSVVRTQPNISSYECDPCYAKFLDNVKIQDNLMVLNWGTNTSVTYERGKRTEEVGNSIGHEIIPFQTPSHQEFDSQMEQVQQFDSKIEEEMPFHERLAKVLDNAYDQNEYEELLRKVNERKPVVKFKNLRDQTISYESPQMGLSYLDHYRDLAKQISIADHQTSLKLLRGFFFWIENLCHEGAYAPWAVSSEVSLIDDCDIMVPLDSFSEPRLLEAGSSDHEILDSSNQNPNTNI